MMPRSSIAIALAAAAVVTFVHSEASAKTKFASTLTARSSTTEYALADLDGDGLKEIVGLSSYNTFTVTGADFALPVRATFQLPYGRRAYRWFTGHFTHDAGEQLCYLDDGYVTHCLRLAGTALVEASYSYSSGWYNVDEIAVGDFDGDGYDEFLSRSGIGTNLYFAVWVYDGHGFVADASSSSGYNFPGARFDLANMAGATCPGTQPRFLVGNYYNDGGARKDDVVIECKGTASSGAWFKRYDAHAYGGKTVFWGAFDSGQWYSEPRDGFEYAVTDADGDGFEDLAAYSTNGGWTLFRHLDGGHQMYYVNSSTVGMGQLLGGSSQRKILFGKVVRWWESGGATRDDAIEIAPGGGMWRVDARYDASASAPYSDTYWWAWTRTQYDLDQIFRGY